MTVLRKVILGSTGIEVSELCLGTLTISVLQADISSDASIPMFRKALAMGINFFDTAWSYQTHDHVRKGLGSDIDDVVVASKIPAKSLADAKKQMEDCFRQLGVDRIDIMLLHLVCDEDDFQARRPVLDHLLELKAAGRIGAVGLSTHSIAGCRSAVAHSDVIEILFPVINSSGAGIVGGSLGEQLCVVRQAHEMGMGVFAMKPLAGGHLRAQAAEAFDYVRSLPCVDSVCVGMKSAEEVDVNTAIFSDGKLPVDQERLAELASTDRKLIINGLCTKCGACLEECDQKALSLGERTAEVDLSKCILCGYCGKVCPEFSIRVI